MGSTRHPAPIQKAARFSTTSVTRWNVSGTRPDDRICFTVDQEDISIWAVGVYLGTETNMVTVKLTLTQVEPKEDVLATVERRLQACGTSAVHEVLLTSAIKIKKDTRYMVTMNFAGITKTFKGERGSNTVKCKDGSIFTFCDAPAPHNGTCTAHGQAPAILYYRSPWTRQSSYQRALIRLRFPLKAEVDKSSQQVQLNRFKFSVRSVREKAGKLQTTITCQPIEEYAKWSVEVHTLCRLVHPTNGSKSHQFSGRGLFTVDNLSVTMFELDAKDLADWDATTETVLETTIRYAKATSPPDVPAEEHLAFGEPWRGSDLVLSFDDGKRLHCHRPILSMASPVLHRMLDGDLKEKKESTIPLPGKDSAAFEKLLRLIYPRETPCDLNYDDAFQLAELFHEYSMKRMEQRTEKIMVGKAEKSNVLRLLKLACKIHFEDLKERCLRLCTELSNEELKKDPEYYLLDKDSLELVQDARMFHANVE